MWTMTELGYYSAVTVAPDGTGETLQVRARSYEDLENLCDWLKLEHGVDADIVIKKRSDYPWRIMLSKELYASFLVAMVEGIDYHNFKDRVHEISAHRAGVYTKVWTDLLEIQWREEDLLPAEPRAPYRSLDQLLRGLDDEDEGSRAYRSIHDMTEQEWQEMMEEAPAPAPRKRNRRRRRSRR